MTSRANVVLIASGRDKSREWLGTGTVVARNRILTARHVIMKEGKQLPDLCVRRADKNEFLPATVRWLGPDGPDVAVLEAALNPEGYSLAPLSARDIATNSAWEAQGYPEVRRELPSEKLEKVGGVTLSCARSEQELILEARTHPEVWGGLSGAAVVIGTEVAGVIRSEPHGWDKKRLLATPVAAFLNLPEFREALGLGESNERLAADLAKVVATITAQMKKLPRVTEALAEKLNLDLILDSRDAASLVTRAVVHERSAEESVKAFTAVDEELKDDAARVSERRALKDLTWWVLPFATDWRMLLLRGRAALEENARFVELPFREMTIAEVILAGIDCRPCRYKEEDAQADRPASNAVIPLPAAARAPFIDQDGKRLVEATAGHLASMLLGLAPDDVRLRKNDRLLLREVNEALEYCCEAIGDARLPRYLLLDDETLREVRDSSGTSATPRLTMAITALGDALPHLRFLHLGDGVPGEVRLALHIGNMWKRTI